jgi:arylsulfatase A-like enzyme/Flp pilus assembly protein TadD
MERSLKTILAVMVPVVTLCSPACSSKPPAPKDRFNVLLVTIDTLRADRLGCYGGTSVPTPNIDRLAGQGTVFARAFAHTPLTLPSHASILLGTTPVAHGVHDNIDFVVRPEHVTLAEHLKANGYRTAAFVSASPLDSRFGLDQGFDVYDDSFMAPGSPKTSPAEQPAETVVDKAMRWLMSVESEPWFLWIHIWDPHADYAAPEPFGSRYRDRPYDGEVAYTDFALGRLFGALEESRTSERTLTVLTADHGEGLGDHGERTHGYLAHNATIWVPLIVAAPGSGSVRSTTPVSHSDIVPTVLDVLGIARPAGLQGVSARRALSGKTLPSRRIYFECLSPYYELGWAPLRGYIAGADKFVQSPIPEVYDLAEDFAETKNLAATADVAAFGKTLERLIADLAPAAPMDSGARTDPELKEKLESLGYVARAGGGLKTSFSVEDDVKTLLPLYNRITDAYSLASQGDRDEAVRRLEAIVGEAKTLDTAYVHLADLHLEAGDRGRALEVLAAGWRRYPASYELLSSYVANLVTGERWDEVVRVVGEARGLLQMDHDGTVWFFQGLAYQRLGNAAGAAAALEKAVAADGEYLAALFNLGAVYLNLCFETGDASYGGRAVPLFERVTALDPGNAEAHILLGRAYVESGQAERAIVALETARGLAPGLANVEFQLGLAFLAKRDFAQAYAHLASFKERVYRTLSPEERANLDGLIKKVQDAGR